MGKKYLWQIMELKFLSKQKSLYFEHLVELVNDSVEHLMSFVLPNTGGTGSLVILELIKRSGRATMKLFLGLNTRRCFTSRGLLPLQSSGCESVRVHTQRGEGSGQKVFPALDEHSKGLGRVTGQLSDG